MQTDGFYHTILSHTPDGIERSPPGQKEEGGLPRPLVESLPIHPSIVLFICNTCLSIVRPVRLPNAREGPGTHSFPWIAISRKIFNFRISI